MFNETPTDKSSGEMPAPLQGRDPETPVMMYCTGGIRCDVYAAYLKEKGFKNVYALKASGAGPARLAHLGSTEGCVECGSGHVNTTVMNTVVVHLPPGRCAQLLHRGGGGRVEGVAVCV